MRKLLLLLAACSSQPDLTYVGMDREAVTCDPEPESGDPLPE